MEYGMLETKAPVYQTQQIREMERLAEERFGIAPQVMMQRAGKAACDYLVKRWPKAHNIAVFCGNGNNGGDGYALAQFAHERGLSVTLWQVGNHGQLKAEALQAFQACEQAHVVMNAYQAGVNLGFPDIIVDAICGIGLHDVLRDDIVNVIEHVQRLNVPIFSLDIPTGIQADTGSVLGAAIHATATMTFIGLKLGLLTGSGSAHTGELVMNDLQLPSEIHSDVQPVADKILLSTYANFLKPRARDWHKGLSGHVLIVGGDYGFSGAARMAAEAALRVGAGLVSVATHPENAVVMNVNRPEIMCHGISNASQLAPLADRADVIVLGPGMGQTDWSHDMWTYVCKKELPLVLDADALNILAQTKRKNNNWVLTPHPGEAARLIQVTAQDVQHDRLKALHAINKRYGGTVVLKGAGTLVLAPNTLPAVCDKGNAGMASGGMGDVLSGVIGGLIAQGIPLGDAAALGVYLHAVAGDLAAKEGERGTLAMDLMSHLRHLCNLQQ
jgi:NAD(P)H-hydrate epimerase